MNFLKNNDDITKLNLDGTYNIKYFDGDMENQVPYYNIRTFKAGTYKAPPYN